MLFKARSQVFPARAGMSRAGGEKLGAISRVPRASGDEPPRVAPSLDVQECSPRERG